MKKSLSLISLLTIVTAQSQLIIGCKTTTNVETTAIKVNENVKLWSELSSSIPKSVLWAKNNNLNTSKTLNTNLKNSKYNIKGKEQISNSYEEFKKNWGYHSKIEGITEKDFNSNLDTIANSFLEDKKAKIEETINDFSFYFSYFKDLPLSNEIILELFEYDFLKGKIVNWILNNKNNLDEITKIFNPFNKIINSLDSFNHKKVLESYYSGDITKWNKDGWLKNYKTPLGFSSEAQRKNSKFLEAIKFTNLDQVAFLESSIKLNGFFYDTTNNLSIGEIFNKAIKYDKSGTASDFNIEIFNKEIKSLWEASSKNTENIINLISILMPIIKYKFFNFTSTTKIEKISTKEKTDPKTGTINVNDIITKIKEVILTKEGFTKFFTDLFFVSSIDDIKLENYLILDFTCDKNKSLLETIIPIKDKIVSGINNFYSTSIKPMLDKIYLEDICNQIEKDLKNLSNEEQLEIKLDFFKILTEYDIPIFINKLKSFKDGKEIKENWEILWKILGVQKNKKELESNSIVEKINKFKETNNDFWNSIPNQLNTIKKITVSTIDFLIKQEVELNINNNDFDIDETTISYEYDETLKQTTLSYDLIDKIKSKTYKVKVVIKGNISKDSDSTKQIWLKSLLLK